MIINSVAAKDRILLEILKHYNGKSRFKSKVDRHKYNYDYPAVARAKLISVVEAYIKLNGTVSDYNSKNMHKYVMNCLNSDNPDFF